MFINIAAIKECSDKDKLDTTAALLKLGEEHGELVAAHINKLGLANKSKSSSPNTLEEVVDVIMCSVDFAFKDGATVDQLNEMIEKKIEKWKKKISDAEELRSRKDVEYQLLSREILSQYSHMKGQ